MGRGHQEQNLEIISIKGLEISFQSKSKKLGA